MNIRKPIVPAFLLLCIAAISSVKAQSGQYLMPWGGMQYTAMLNFDDYNADNYGKERNRVNTYRGGGGIDYINNFNSVYGFQTGLYFSAQGQKYSGVTQGNRIYNYTDTTNISYTSHAYLNYLRVPLMFRFNSVMDQDDRINVSIFLGVQMGYLLSVTHQTSPDAPDSILKKYPNFDFKKLYHTIDFGLGAGAQINTRINDQMTAVLGIRFDRSLGDIENTSYVLPSDAPVEWLYPLSVKKSQRPSHTDELVRMPTKNIDVNVYLGFAIKIKNGKPTPPHPVYEDENQ